MKKIGIFIFVMALALGLVLSNLFSFGKFSGKIFNFSSHFGKIEGSGVTASEDRDLTGFRSVKASGAFEIEIAAQKEFVAEVQADDNLLPMIRTEVRGGTLHLSTEGKLSTRNPIRLRISAPDIESLDISGAANVTLNDLKNSVLEIDSSGASKLAINGETVKLVIDVGGATKLDAENLRAKNASVDASGASGVSVNVSGHLKADASGASKIVYSGSPAQVEKKSSGASSVSQK
ncbi:MAG: head GIN domain-containing protein [Pyrinomonadaceae bacterium]